MPDVPGLGTLLDVARSSSAPPPGSRSAAGSRSDGSRFVEGFVVASLVFCVGPLAVLGPLVDGLGRGIEELALTSTLDGFASVAFAAAFGWGVAASALVGPALTAAVAALLRNVRRTVRPVLATLRPHGVTTRSRPRAGAAGCGLVLMRSG